MHTHGAGREHSERLLQDGFDWSGNKIEVFAKVIPKTEKMPTEAH